MKPHPSEIQSDLTVGDRLRRSGNTASSFLSRKIYHIDAKLDGISVQESVIICSAAVTSLVFLANADEIMDVTIASIKALPARPSLPNIDISKYFPRPPSAGSFR